MEMKIPFTKAKMELESNLNTLSFNDSAAQGKRGNGSGEWVLKKSQNGIQSCYQVRVIKNKLQQLLSFPMITHS